jgi:ketosteroid isomerase-like protein
LAGAGLYGQPAARAIAPGAPVSQTIAGSEVQAYTFTAAANSIVTFVAMQDGVDVVVTLQSPDGKVLAQVDSPNGMKGPERLNAFLEAAGTYRVEIRRLAEAGNAESGRYEARLEGLRAATDAERRNATEEQALLAREEQWKSALERHDIDALGRIISDDFTYFSTNPGGQIDRAGQLAAWTENYKANAGAKEVHTHTDRSIKVFGDTAVASGGALIAITNKGNTTQIPGRFIHVWQKRAGEWKLAADHFYIFGSTPVSRSKVDVSAAALAAVAGTYEGPGGKITIAPDGDGLIARPVENPGEWSMPFVPESPTEFFSPVGDFQLVFVKNGAVAERGLFINGSRVERFTRVTP